MFSRSRFLRLGPGRRQATRLTVVIPPTSRHCGSGLIKLTQPLLIWPIIGRVVAGFAIVVLQSLWEAHRAEAARLARQYGTEAQQSTLSLTREESAAILGVSLPAGGRLEGADAAVATANFRRLFLAARRCHNPYLQGKLSGAYRVLVDSNWDATDAGNAWLQEGQDRYGTSGPPRI